MQEDFGRLLLEALFVQVSLDKGVFLNRLDEAESVLKAEIQIVHLVCWYEYFTKCAPCNPWFHNKFKVHCTFATGVLWALL